MAAYKVGYFVGSLATKSINRLLATALVKLAPTEIEMTEISFKDLPLYSYDYDADYPPVATEFKNAIAAVDAVLFVTPEYNRSIPGALKNAIDWASRPYGKNAFTRKPSAVIGTSPGKMGTAVAASLTAVGGAVINGIRPGIAVSAISVSRLNGMLVGMACAFSPMIGPPGAAMGD